jgi:hypothetical protein
MMEGGDLLTTIVLALANIHIGKLYFEHLN